MENIPSDSVGAELIHKYISGSVGDVWEARCWLTEQLLDLNSPHWNTNMVHAALHSNNPCFSEKASTPTSPPKVAGMRNRRKKLTAALIMLTDKNGDIARKVLPHIAQYLSHKNK